MPPRQGARAQIPAAPSPALLGFAGSSRGRRGEGVEVGEEAAAGVRVRPLGRPEETTRGRMDLVKCHYYHDRMQQQLCDHHFCRQYKQLCDHHVRPLGIDSMRPLARKTLG
jgi:hypothetical protein